MKTLVTIATYNERENLQALIREVLAARPGIEVLVIDDNSPDGTGELAEELRAADARVHVIHRPAKLGLGSAILEALQYARDHRYDFALNMDADFSHHPRYIGALVEAMSRSDVAIGSRYVTGGGVEGWSLERQLISRAVNWYSRWILGLSARDSSGGFRCYRVSALSQVNFGEILSRGYSFQEEFLFRLARVGLRIAEVPIVFAKREKGASKVSLREMVRSAWALLRLRVVSLFKRASG